MKLKLINGNNQNYTTQADLLVCFYKLQPHFINRLEKELKLKLYKRAFDLFYFKPRGNAQIVKLLTWASCYSFKISYSDNLMEKSTLFFDLVDRKEPFFFNNK